MLKKMLQIIFICLVGGFIQTASAFDLGDTVCVSGAGTSAFNGTYTYSDSNNLLNTADTHKIYYGSGYGGSFTILNKTSYNKKYQTTTNKGVNTVANLINVTWSFASGGTTLPMPTITSGACAAPTPVPLSPLGKLLLGLLFAIGSVMMLQRKYA